jgi:hypothetical protein
MQLRGKILESNKLILKNVHNVNMHSQASQLLNPRHCSLYSSMHSFRIVAAFDAIKSLIRQVRHLEVKTAICHEDINKLKIINN